MGKPDGIIREKSQVHIFLEPAGIAVEHGFIALLLDDLKERVRDLSFFLHRKISYPVGAGDGLHIKGYGSFDLLALDILEDELAQVRLNYEFGKAMKNKSSQSAKSKAPAEKKKLSKFFRLGMVALRDYKKLLIY